VIVKPSEVSANCAAWLAANIPKYLDPNCVRVVEGGPDETTLLLKEKFDYIFYTGNTVVGRIVMKAAAEHLTPVTLELGGKTPCIVDRDANLDVSARRICSGKFSNAGQTCVAPDYILVHQDVEEKLIEKLKSTIHQFYGDDPEKSVDFTRVINTRHTERLALLLEGEENNILLGGQVNRQDKYVAPTLVKAHFNSVENCKLMKDEIFGPILPIITVSSIDEAIQFVNDRPKPLALYVFSENKRVAEKVTRETSSGGAAVNETVLHVACRDLPFGGVGPSGIGAYNGKTTFDTFTHHKPVLSRPSWIDPSIRYPPFTPNKIWWVQTLMSLKIPFTAKAMALVVVVVIPLLAVGAHYYRSRL